MVAASRTREAVLSVRTLFAVGYPILHILVTMLRLAISPASLRRVVASLIAAQSVSVQKNSASLWTTCSTSKFNRARQSYFECGATLPLGFRRFSSELSPPFNFLVISANCAKRIAHLQKQKAAVGSCMPLFLHFFKYER